MSMVKSSKTFICSSPRPWAPLRLFCFPYAGGTSAVFREWARALPATIEVVAAELPGHGHRIAEPLMNQLNPVINEIADSILPFLDRDYAFFGHSMGATLAYELSHRLRNDRGTQPCHLFVAGRNAPHVPSRKAPTYALSDADFVDELRRLNGTPTEVLANPDMLDFVMPLLRADFQLIQTYKYSPRPPLDCPVSAFTGEEDPDVLLEDVRPWSQHTSGNFSMTVMAGDHFFLDNRRDELLRHITTGLGDSVPSTLLQA